MYVAHKGHNKLLHTFLNVFISSLFEIIEKKGYIVSIYDTL